MPVPTAFSSEGVKAPNFRQQAFLPDETWPD